MILALMMSLSVWAADSGGRARVESSVSVEGAVGVESSRTAGRSARVNHRERTHEAGGDELHAIMSTRSVAELDRQERESARVRRAAEDCAAELRTHLLPRSCFRELKFRKTDDSNARLTKICIANAHASRSRLDLSRSLRPLPTDCQRAAADRLEDLQYIDEAAKPELSAIRTLGPDIETDTGQLD